MRGVCRYEKVPRHFQSVDIDKDVQSFMLDEIVACVISFLERCLPVLEYLYLDCLCLLTSQAARIRNCCKISNGKRAARCNGTGKLQQRGLTSWGSTGMTMKSHCISSVIHIGELPNTHALKTLSHKEIQSEVSFVPIMMKLAPFAAASMQ